jgi:ATP-binding cassette, subfamily B, bacterial
VSRGPRAFGAVAALAWQAAALPWLSALALAVLSGAAVPFSAWLSMRLIDDLTAAHPRAGLVVLLTMLSMLLGALSMVTGSLSTWAGTATQRSVSLRVNDRLYQAVSTQIGLARLEDPAFQDELRLAEQAAQDASTSFSVFSLGVLRATVTIIGFLGALLAVWAPMTVLLALSCVPTVWSQITLSRQQSAAATASMGRFRQRRLFQNLLSDTRAGKEIRLFGLGGLFRTRMMSAFEEASGLEYAVARRTSLVQSLLALFGGLVLAGGAAVVAYHAAHGSVAVGELVLFLAAAAGVQASISALSSQTTGLAKSFRLFHHYLAVVGLEGDLPNGSAPAAPLREAIVVEDLWFRYTPESDWILRGLNLELPAGRTTGLVGLNGAGKTTLVKLLCRFYDPERGRIRWDGVDLRELEAASLRARLSVTFQDFMTYDMTVAENIGLGDVTNGMPDLERIRAAARTAGLDEVVEALPAGYDTLLSRIFLDGRAPGVALSGGQSQRLALARSSLRAEADLLVLDEPSAGLDAEAEHRIHAGMRARRAGRTTLLVTHRLSAMRDADRILVLADGAVTEQGTHDELMAADGEYARLFRLQAAGYQDERVLTREAGNASAREPARKPTRPSPVPAING